MVKAKDQTVFNVKKRWLRRRYISSVELYSGVTLIAIAVFIGLWFINQRDNYDHGERDLDPELLTQETTLELYTRPLKLWQEPGSLPAQGAPGPALAPFPAQTVDPQWQLAGRVRSFQADNLFEKINGEAEKFLQLNFQQLYYLVLKSTVDRSEIAIELYDHGDVTHSIGIFSGHTSPSNEVIKRGDVTYFNTGAGMIGRKGQYFFRVAATELSDSVMQKVDQLAQTFAQLSEQASSDSGSDMPFEFRVLNENLQIQSDAIAFAAQNVFQFDFAANFWFGTLDSDDEVKAFIHVAESAEQARELYQRLLVEFEFDYEVTPLAEDGGGTDSVVLKHRFLDNFLVMQYRGPYLYGIENLASQQQIAQLMGQLSEGIDEKAG